MRYRLTFTVEAESDARARITGQAGWSSLSQRRVIVELAADLSPEQLWQELEEKAARAGMLDLTKGCT